jgi:hypothetical protein
MLLATADVAQWLAGSVAPSGHRRSASVSMPQKDRNDIDEQDLDDRHAWKNHRVADIRFIRRRQPVSVCKDGWIAACPSDNACDLIERHAANKHPQQNDGDSEREQHHRTEPSISRPVSETVAAKRGPDVMPTWARNNVSPKLRSTRLAESGIVQFRPPVRRNFPRISATISTPDNPKPILPIPGRGMLSAPSRKPSAMPIPMEI